MQQINTYHCSPAIVEVSLRISGWFFSFFSILYGDQNFPIPFWSFFEDSEFLSVFFIGIRISKKVTFLSEFLVGIRTSMLSFLWGSEFLKIFGLLYGDQNFLRFFGLLYGDENFYKFFGLLHGNENFWTFFGLLLWGSEFLKAFWTSLRGSEFLNVFWTSLWGWEFLNVFFPNFYGNQKFRFFSGVL